METPLATSPTYRLDLRYGRTPTDRTKSRRFAWAAAGSFVAVFAAWVVWGGLDGSGDSIQIVDIGFTGITNTEITVSWQLTVAPGTATTCALEAQNSAHGIVGWRIVDLDQSELRTRAFTETVTTTERAVTGLIYRCWLP